MKLPKLVWISLSVLFALASIAIHYEVKIGLHQQHSGSVAECVRSGYKADMNDRSKECYRIYTTPLGLMSELEIKHWQAVTNLTRPAKRVVRFYNQRGTAEQWIKEGKNAVKWTRLSCHDFVDNQVRLQLFVLAYNLGNFLRQAVLPKAVRHWTLTTLREKLIKIGAKVVRHSRKIVFQMAEVAVPRELFRAILERIGRLRLATAMSG